MLAFLDEPAQRALLEDEFVHRAGKGRATAAHTLATEAGGHGKAMLQQSLAQPGIDAVVALRPLDRAAARQETASWDRDFSAFYGQAAGYGKGQEDRDTPPAGAAGRGSLDVSVVTVVFADVAVFEPGKDEAVWSGRIAVSGSRSARQALVLLGREAVSVLRSRGFSSR